MVESIVCFVLGGGTGVRLWPLSRQDRPKQFHDLTAGADSMLARTLRRLKARKRGDTVLNVIASERHVEHLRSAIASIDLNGGSLLLEPIARNTAAAVAVAVRHTLAAFGDSLMLIAPTDHEIVTDAQFWESVEAGLPAADAGQLVVFGVTPDRPETGYGYIEAEPGTAGVRTARRFIEKPDRERAAAFLAADGFFWNAGIFLARASTLKRAFTRLRPDILDGAGAALARARRAATGLHLSSEAYLALPVLSFDRAIMEKAGDIAMVPARFSWNDIGSWRSLREIGPMDADGNVVVGDVLAIDCRNSYLRSDGRLLSVVGLDGVAVVAMGDATFVAPLGRSQDVRAVVARLEQAGRTEARHASANDGTGRRSAQPTSRRMKS